MARSQNLVILFGAGATRGALKAAVPPPPLDADFFDIAGQLTGRGSQVLARRVIRDLFELYQRVTGVGLEQYFRDIEARAEIGRFAKSKNKPKDWKRRQEDLEELIRRVIIHTTCDLSGSPAKPRASKAHKGILRHLRAGDTLITFNYDTVIEESWPELAPGWRPRDGYGLSAAGSTHDWARAWKDAHPNSVTPSRVALLKLHGSINWTLYPTREVRLKDRPYVVRSGIVDKCSVLPPGWHKQIHVNPYRTLWRQARLRLESCSALAIIGYSLPEADVLAKALFAEVSRLRAARKQFLRHLHIADPSAAVKNRFVDLFAPALGPVGRTYFYHDIDELNQIWGTRPPTR